MDRFLIDLTRAHAGTEGEVLRALHDAHPWNSGTAVECLVLAAQAVADGQYGVVRADVGETADDAAVAAAVHQRVSQARADGREVAVASFRGSVKNVAEMLGVMLGGVTFVHLAPFAPAAEAAAEGMVWDDAWMPRDEAVDALVQAIGRSAARMRMTDLRKALTAYNPRFRKQVGTFNSRPKFVSTLVGFAVDRGLAVTTHTSGEDNNPVLELTPAGRARVTAPVLPSPMPPPGQDAIASADGSRSRSHLFVDVLRKNEMGPFQELRLDIYEELERLVKEGTRPPQQLIRDAVNAVRDQRKGAPSKSGKQFPWTGVRTFMGKLTRRVPVLLHDGRPVTLSLGQDAVAVTELAHGWRLTLDGELICFMLERGVQITVDDYDELAGALYNSRRDEFYDLAHEVVAHLARSGRVVESPDDAMTIVLAPPAG
ncbi:hypothetical protein [Actinomadura rugatobispora]|uniref:Uncharacterized protein n=1 Tax=Actinomadura rugatobispora TaxID=1994 RepID=A0ABW1AA25_9ACTN|nr:hypothetical protein GCM10010200_009960 [Actinomadura rugatobispora]